LRTGDRVRFRAIASAEFRPAGAVAEPGPARRRGVVVERAGTYTTVQDLGRLGWRAEGVPVGGAADTVALRLANLLVGNDEAAAGLEITSVGPRLRFSEETWVAVTGAEFAGIPLGRPLRMAAGSALDCGVARRGYRGYLAVVGGIAVAPVLGSASTNARAGFGGFRGRVLRDGDVLPLAATCRRMVGRWHLDPRLVSGTPADCCVRVLPGAQGHEFPRSWLEAVFVVSRNSDRMGLRLEGAALARATQRELVSTPVAPGTIQVPPDGQPIVLLADAQTLGGYPQLAHVATVDLPVLAQLRPGDTLRFTEVTLGEAQAALAAREHSLALLREGLQDKWA
jgi:antagonist of KipI